MSIQEAIAMITENALPYVVPVASIGLTYVLGRLQVLHSDKKAAYKEAYKKFYLPFISALFETQIWYTSFSQLERADQDKLFLVVSEHIQYMDEPILEYVNLFYGHYSVVISDREQGLTGIITPARLDEIFSALTTRVLSRCTWLAKKLHQPKLGQFVQKLYDEDRSV